MSKRFIVFPVRCRRAMNLSPGECWIGVGEKTIAYTENVGTCQQFDQSACPRLGRESHCESSMRRVSRQVSTLAGEYALDCQLDEMELGSVVISYMTFSGGRLSHRMPGGWTGFILVMLWRETSSGCASKAVWCQVLMGLFHNLRGLGRRRWVAGRRRRLQWSTTECRTHYRAHYVRSTCAHRLKSHAQWHLSRPYVRSTRTVVQVEQVAPYVAYNKKSPFKANKMKTCLLINRKPIAVNKRHTTVI